MREWKGMHDGSVDVGNGLTTVRNVSFHQDGIVQRRPQLQDRYDLDAVVIQGLTHPLGGSFLVSADGAGQLLGVDLPTGTSTTLASGLSADIHGSLTNHQAKLYYNDDFDDVRRMERGDLAAVTAGIDAPTVAPTASTQAPIGPVATGVTLSSNIITATAASFSTYWVGRNVTIIASAASVNFTVQTVSSGGTAFTVSANWAFASNSAASTYLLAQSNAATTGAHRFRYRYRDAKTGYPSNPSTELSVTVGSNASRINFTASADPKVTGILLEATTVDGSIFYQVGEYSNATETGAIFALTDVVLEQGIDINAVYGDFGHEPPPFVELMCEHRGRMFGWKRSVRTRTACTVASGVGSISGTGFPINGAWDGRLLTVNSEKTTSIIASSTSTVLTLADVYAGTASGAANTIRVFHPQPDMLLWSRAGFPESWKLSTWARRVLQGGSDEPSALFSAYGTLWLCGQHSVRTFDYTNDPAAAKLEAVPTEMGAYNQRCIVQADGRTFGFGQAGAWEIQGRNLTRISDDTEKQLTALIDTAQFEDFHGTYDPYERSVTWYFTRTGDTSPKDGICYFTETEQWQFVSYRQAIRASTTYGSATYTYRPYLADTNGWTWRVGDDRPADSLPSAMTSGVLTTASANSTTVINIVENLPTGSGDAKGAMLYWPAAGESRVIASNTTNTVTVTPGFTTAPGTGVSLYLGSIPVYLKSDRWMMRSPQHLKRVPYLGLEHLSDETSPECYLSLYQNVGSTAAQWTTGSADVPLTGVTNTNAIVKTIDLGQGSGILYMPMPEAYVNYWRWEFTQDKPAGALKLMDVQFILTDSSQVDTNIKPT